MEQSVSKIQDYLSDDQLVQTDSAFVGTFLWKAVDLVTFGVLEKEPKMKKKKAAPAAGPAAPPAEEKKPEENKSNDSNSTNATNSTEPTKVDQNPSVAAPAEEEDGLAQQFKKDDEELTKLEHEKVELASLIEKLRDESFKKMHPKNVTSLVQKNHKKRVEDLWSS